jgi:hypothetical protein
MSPGHFLKEQSMSHPLNPFIRGYRRLRIERSLLITFDDDCPPVWRPLHPSQAHLSDAQVALFPCIFCDDFAVVTEGQEVSSELNALCPNDGIVRTVVHAVMAEEAGQPLHVGDSYSEESAREVVRRLNFETGFYSRCWEISSSHITEEANIYLAEWVDRDTPTRFLFAAFRISDSPVIGVKLIATPWTDEVLQWVEGLTAEQLRQAYRKEDMPESLIDVLFLAAQADVRLLVFDGDAAVLDGLPVYES